MSLKDVSRNGRGWILPLSVGCMLIFACVAPAIMGIRSRQATDAELRAFRHNQLALKRVVSALRAYRAEHSFFPHSDRGSAAALYLLKGLVDPAAFDLEPRTDAEGRAYWDDRASRLANSDVEYVNEPHQSNMSYRVVLATDANARGMQYYATGDSSVHMRTDPIPAAVLLGCWTTSSRFLFRERETFDRWCRLTETHGFGTETIGVNGTDEVSYRDGTLVRYEFNGGIPLSCEIRNADGGGGHVDIAADRYGIVLSIAEREIKAGVADKDMGSAISGQ